MVKNAYEHDEIYGYTLHVFGVMDWLRYFAKGAPIHLGLAGKL